MGASLEPAVLTVLSVLTVLLGNGAGRGGQRHAFRRRAGDAAANQDNQESPANIAWHKRYSCVSHWSARTIANYVDSSNY